VNVASLPPAVEPRSQEQPNPILEAATLVVMLATHNGAGWIGRVLEAYRAQRGVDFPWALLVVDNGSTDETPDILASFAGALPLVVVEHALPGKNAALNRGLELTADLACDYIFTDDDALPAPDFLMAWKAALASRPDHALFGGTVIAHFDGIDAAVTHPYATWYPEIYAANQRPEGEIPPGAIFGPNMAVSGSIIRAGHRFDERIGPSSSDPAYPMGSETEFCVRVARAAEARCLFVSGPEVRHIVRPNQATEAFILARAYRHGRGCAIKDGPIRSGFSHHIKEGLLIARFSIGGLLGAAEARWNAAWHRGFRAGLREARATARIAAPAEG